MNKLRFLRLKSGQSQSWEELRSGVPRWRISLGERGLLKLSDAELEAIGKAFDLPPETSRGLLEVISLGEIK